MQLNNRSLKKAFLALFIFLSLSLAGISAGVSLAEEAPTADFPRLNKGDIYIFQKGKFRLMYRVLETSPDGSFVVEIANEATLNKKKIRIDRNLSNKNMVRSHNEYNYFIDFPLQVGKTWKDKVALRSPAYSGLMTETYRYKVQSYEDVEIGQMKLKAFKIKFQPIEGKGSGTIWYSPELQFVVKESINITQERNAIALKSRMGLVEYRGKYQESAKAAVATPARATTTAMPSKTAPAKTDGPVAEAPELNAGDTYTFKRGRKSYTYKITEVHEDGSFLVKITDNNSLESKLLRFDHRFSTKNYIKWHNEYNFALEFPLFVGKTWEDKVSKLSPTYSYIYNEVYKFKVSAYEDVEIGQGKVKAFKVTFSLAAGKGSGTIWYSPEMKFVVKEDVAISHDMAGFTNRSRVSLVSYAPASGAETMLASKPAPAPKPMAAQKPAPVITKKAPVEKKPAPAQMETAKAAETVPEQTTAVSAPSLDPEPAQKPAPVVAKKAPKKKKPAPVQVDVYNIPRTGAANPDAIAVVIGNRDYNDSDIPSVDYAINDAKLIRKYLIEAFGYKDGNIIMLENASQANLSSIFGNNMSHKGKLYNWLKKGKSDIFIYYSGHGAPDLESKNGYLVPVDADPQTIAFTGYPLDTFYKNLKKISKDMATPNITVVIDACFSGASEGGMLIKNASPIFIETTSPLMSLPNTVVMTSSSGGEVSSWYPDKKQSMFTYFFLESLAKSISEGKQDITAGDVFGMLSDETEGVPYYARRMHGRTQTPTISGDRKRILLKVE